MSCVAGFGFKSSPVSPPQYCPGSCPVRGLPRYRQCSGVPQPPADCRALAPPPPAARIHPSGHLPHLQACACRSGTKPYTIILEAFTLILCSVADPDPGSGAFLTFDFLRIRILPGHFCGQCKIISCQIGSRINH
jgi:hypothetical protein